MEEVKQIYIIMVAIAINSIISKHLQRALL